MAKSKSGGTRTFLRGRVGSDVYSVGRDGKGKKQQVVRSLAESVANPQTQAQMRGRMIMSTIAQAQAVLRPIVDHSFDNVSGARANLAEFTSRNYALIKADVAAHPSTGNKFGLVKYQEKGAKQGAYVIAAGAATIPSALVLTKSTGVIAISLPSDAITVAGLKAALGMTNEEYFTLVGIDEEGAAKYERFRVNPNLSDSTAIAAGNIGDVFAVEGNAEASVAIASNVISITLASVKDCCAVIVSLKASGKYIHNDAVLGDGSNMSYPSDTALPTYPVGAQAYLNGGDIFGQSESFNGGGSPTPTPTPSESPVLTKLETQTEDSLLSGSYTDSESSSLSADFIGTNLSGAVLVLSANQNIAVGGTLNVSDISSNKKYTFSANSGTTGTLTLSETAERLYLVKDNAVAQVLALVNWQNVDNDNPPDDGD